MQFHISNGDQPVKPCVGHRLHRPLESITFDSILQPLPLRWDGLWKRSPTNHGDVALLDDRFDLLCGPPIERSSIRHRLNKIPASLRCVRFEFGAVHRSVGSGQ